MRETPTLTQVAHDYGQVRERLTVELGRVPTHAEVAIALAAYRDAERLVLEHLRSKQAENTFDRLADVRRRCAGAA